MSFDFSGPLDFTMPANADQSAKQYRFVTINSSGNAAVSARGELSAGVQQNAPAAAGRPVRIRPFGPSKVVLGGNVTRGQAVVADANGAGVNASSADNNYMGIALETGASGDIIAVLIQPRGLS